LAWDDDTPPVTPKAPAQMKAATSGRNLLMRTSFESVLPQPANIADGRLRRDAAA
jgi:hypothetical protein